MMTKGVIIIILLLGILDLALKGGVLSALAGIIIVLLSNAFANRLFDT